MALRVLQSGQGASRPLVAAFGPMAAAKLPKIFGPAACIVFDNDGHGTETMPQIVDFAANQGGFNAISSTAMIGFSIGCSRVRGLRLGGASASAYLLVDGTHASLPPQAWQIEWIRDLANEARAGKLLLVASHTYQTYVEKKPDPYAASVTVLRLATGFALAQGGPPTAPVLTKDPVTAPPTSGLWVYSYASAAADYEAHTYQGGPALHTMAAAHLTPRLAQLGAYTPGATTAALTRALLMGDSLAIGLTAPLRSRFRTAGVELEARAKNGTRIDDWSQSAALSEGLSRAPQLTLISLGTNDLGANPADYKRALVATLVTRIRAAGSAVAWILPPSMPIADRGGTRALLAGELAKLGVPAFESEKLTLPRAPDKIHLTPAGYDLWAGQIWQWLTARPAATSPPWAPGPIWNGGPASSAAGAGSQAPSDTGLPALMMLGVLASVLRS